MKKKTKIILGAIFTVLLLVGIVFAGIVGVLGYGFYKIGGPEMVRRLQQANADGTEYGKTTDQNGCMLKGYTLNVSKTSVDLTAEEFVRGCLIASRPSADFCEGVTSVFDREYFKNECQKVGRPTVACEESFLAKRNFCRRQRDD